VRTGLARLTVVTWMMQLTWSFSLDDSPLTGMPGWPEDAFRT